MSTNVVKAIPLQSIDAATLTGAGMYMPVTPTGLPHACFEINIVNASTVSVTISLDGVTDHDFLGAAGAQDVAPLDRIKIQAQTNSLPNSYNAQFKQGQIIYVAGAMGAGLIYVSGYYQ